MSDCVKARVLDLSRVEYYLRIDLLSYVVLRYVRLPALEMLRERGNCHSDCVSATLMS